MQRQFDESSFIYKHINVRTNNCFNSIVSSLLIVKQCPNMANIIVTGVLFLVVVAVVAEAIRSKQEMWKDHSAAVGKFPCEPRPRSFRLSEVIENFKPNKKMLPMSTVLYRYVTLKEYFINEVFGILN